MNTPTSLRTLPLATHLCACPCHAEITPDDDVLLVSFFRGNGEAGVFLAASDDGLRSTPLNDDKPVMKPAACGKLDLTNDPPI